MTEIEAKNLPTRVMNLQDLHEVLEMYNDVTQKLQVSHERLQNEVQRLRDQLEQKNKELELKNRLAALGEMAAGIAHEIRNPLGGIALYASTLAAEVSDRPAAVQLVSKISNGVKGLNILVSDMLAFTRDLNLNKRECDLADMILAAVEMVMPTLLQHKVKMNIDDGLTGLTMQADPKLMERVLVNLIGNAAEAIGESRDTGGEILIMARPIRDQVDLTIADNGPGIPADALEKIFNPFFTTKHTGTGLGLAIVHRIIEGHGGTIRAENLPEGKGAKFVLRI